MSVSGKQTLSNRSPVLDFSHRHWWNVFWLQVDKNGPNGCWIWKGKLNKAGYGQFKCMDFTTRFTHRIAYALYHGELPPWSNKPPRVEIDHLCRVVACLNPDHLEAVTHTENLRRGKTVNARFAKQTHCKRGHEFTPDNIYWKTYSWGRARNCRRCQREIHQRRYIERNGPDYWRKWKKPKEARA